MVIGWWPTANYYELQFIAHSYISTNQWIPQRQRASVTPKSMVDLLFASKQFKLEDVGNKLSFLRMR